ncbi:MAG: recombination-associated protein RdgC [Agitococcus sp.]|nr:recombination-associated protein RdgC [Agitococcus sp.]MDO9177624.1 recombination-associated protein RdgC [Agitococcus sp.]
MFKNAIAYRIRGPWNAPSVSALDVILDRFKFVPCAPTEEISAGWASPRSADHSPLSEQISGQLILKLAVERKAVPGSAVNVELERRCKRIEEERGTRPQRKEKKAMKEEIIRDFLPRAFSKRAAHFIWIDTANHILVVDTGSRTTADLVAENVLHLMKSTDHPISLAPLNTHLSPAVAMSHWLTTKEAPAGFTVDRDLVLQQPDNEKACVRYSRNSLDIDEVAQHIAEGKMPVSLALTWESNVSFILTADMALKKVTLLDDVFKDADEEGGFDGDVALSTGQLALLIPDLLLALGGEVPPEETTNNAQ